MTASAAAELARLGAIETEIEELLAERASLVVTAQRKGASWQAIGSALGISRQSAWEAYRDRTHALIDTVASRHNRSEQQLLESAGHALSAHRAGRRKR